MEQEIYLDATELAVPTTLTGLSVRLALAGGLSLLRVGLVLDCRTHADIQQATRRLGDAWRPGGRTMDSEYSPQMGSL